MPGSSNNTKSTVPCCKQKRRVSKTRSFQKDNYHPNCIPQNDNGSENIKKVINKNRKTNQCGAVGSEKREVVKLISHDMIREIIIPKPDNFKAVVFDSSRFGYLKDKSKHLTEKDKQEMINKVKEKKAKEAAESAMRKKDLQSCDIYREHGTHLQELEEEAERRANHLLARAFELRQEQEDEIKKCNALILGTKCHAIRDAQMAEKALIQKELEEEERRLEMMMEEERLKAVREQEKLKEREAMKKKAFTEAILEQIKENEIQREMVAESIEEESRLANEAAMQSQLDELKTYKERQEEQAKLRQEMHMINQQLQRIAATEREENRLADLKVQEFMRRKAVQEKAREEEANQLRLAKEKELARLRAMQERAADVQAQKDEINAQRIQDEVEREWRRKEKEAALRRAQENEELKKARSKQVEDRRRCQAIEIQREKEESEKIAKVNLAALQREQEENMRRLCATDEHRMALLKQINEKERERIKNRQQQFQEGVAIKMEEKKRNETLKETMMKKMAQIRGHRVPEKYVREVERQLKLNE